MGSCSVHENHPLVAPDCGDPFENWEPVPVPRGPGAAEWVCPTKTQVAGPVGEESACPIGRAVGWGAPERRAGPRAARLRVLVMGEAVLGGCRAPEALKTAAMDEAEATSPHWR
ncbi:MAG: hypothetical protein OXN79_06290 [bacterium]|nr:hypothetical protein [bacterium]